jgi:hypothetical protein
MTTFTWTVSVMDCVPSEDGHSDVVKIVHWRCSGAEDTFSGSVYSTCALPAPEGAFIPYPDLTENEVLGWIWANGVDKTATEASVQTQIDIQINPPIVTPPLPWVA